MSELRDKTEKRLLDIISDARLTAYQDGKAGHTAFRIGNLDFQSQILSIPELAVVDREAELPDTPCKRDGYAVYWRCYQLAQQDMKEAGWVKEVK